MYILGINNGHDRAAALLKDGQIRFAVEQERIDRKKHSSGKELPWEAIRYCLDAEGINIKDVDLAVGTGLWNYSDLPRLLSSFKKFEIVSHHLAHAYCVFYSSPFERSLVIIWDGTGNYLGDCTEEVSGLNYSRDNLKLYESESYYLFEQDKSRVILKKGAPNPKEVMRLLKTNPVDCGKYIQSLGNLYASFSSYIFGNWQESGKVMGLAAFGENTAFKTHKLISRKGIDYQVHGYGFLNEFNSPNNWRDKNNIKLYQDLSWKVQNELEESILEITRTLRNQLDITNLSIGGGVALNCIANGKIMEQKIFDNIFIHPAPGDGGTALGAAFYGYVKNGGDSRYPINNSFWGREYSNDEIHDRVNWYMDRYYLNNILQIQKLDDIPFTIAKLIADGSIIGWFQGRSEFGPRALGARSILCDCRKKEMKDILNNKIKHREPFRPFAPSVLVEYANEYFHIDNYNSKFMSFAVKVREEKKHLIPAIVHVDGTARLQTVHKESNALFYDLVFQFLRITGIPMILNTSFNRAGEPIVETPEDAIKTFFFSEMDYLSIGDLLLKKNT